MRIQPVSHQVEFTIRRYKRDVPFALKLVKANTLVEFDVFHLYELAMSCPVLHFKQDLVVQTEFELWHTRKEASHMDAPYNLRSQHISVR
jgi:hypothetical protein